MGDAPAPPYSADPRDKSVNTCIHGSTLLSNLKAWNSFCHRPSCQAIVQIALTADAQPESCHSAQSSWFLSQGPPSSHQQTHFQSAISLFPLTPNLVCWRKKIRCQLYMHAKYLAVIRKAKEGWSCIWLKIISLLNELFEWLVKKQYH